MKNRKKHLWGVIILLAVFAAGAAIVMLLWNWLIPTVIGWSAVGYWQAAGILLLCKLLFGGFGKMGHGGFGPHRGFHARHGLSEDEKARMRERVKNMSPDDRRDYIRRHMFGMPGEWENGGK